MLENKNTKNTNLTDECKNLQLIIDQLSTGKETFNTEDFQYQLEDAIDFLQGFLKELRDINNQIIKLGNTQELLERVNDKYTELWLFHVIFPIDSIAPIIGRLWHYSNGN